MVRIVFIGDELSAAGFRLAGASTYTPDKQQTIEVFSKLRRDCELLLMTAEYASVLPPDVVQQALRESKPLMLVVPDMRHRSRPPDLGREVDRALGIES